MPFKKSILCVCYDISEKNKLTLFIFGTVINHKKCLMHIYNNVLSLCAKMQHLCSLFHYFCISVVISRVMNEQILVILDSVSNNHRCLRHINILWFCTQIGYLYLLCAIFCNIAHVYSWMLIYQKSLMHVQSKLSPCQNRVN